ncbi:MAG: WbqC family protein [Ignavibacteria bacterium]|nr:WbqC family protein [Ignavibacteria bacterium]
MKIAIMQPYLFPYLGYFQLINYADKFVILDDVQFINKGRINRNYILNADKPLLFTIPVFKPESRSLITDVTVSEDTKLIKKFLKTVQINYAKAPYFNDVFPLLKSIFSKEIKSISGLALSGIKTINEYLNISTDIVKTSSLYNNSNLKGEKRIIDICKLEGADEYVNLPGGMDLYSHAEFEKSGISLKFIKINNIKYKQFNNEFVSSLSVIDNLMFNSRTDVISSLSEFEIL